MQAAKQVPQPMQRLWSAIKTYLLPNSSLLVVGLSNSTISATGNSSQGDSGRFLVTCVQKVRFKDFCPNFWQKIELDFLPKVALKIFYLVIFVIRLSRA